MKTNKQKLYVVRKYIMANSATDAIKKDRTHPVDEIWIDDSFKNQLAPALGFDANLTNNND